MDAPPSDFLSLVLSLLDHPLFTMGGRAFTLGALGKFLLVLTLLILLARVVAQVLLRRALARTRVDPALQFAVVRIVGYSLVLLAVYIALNLAGFDLGALAVLAGAIGVGLGFGLQNIANNFISGIIILAERPIKLGDRVEVGGIAGRIRRISLRSTTVITNDNISIIVPNSDFITQTVINWSHGDPKVRIRLPVGVAYGTDTEKLTRVLLEVAAANEHVLPDPIPAVYFDGFGDSSLNFELAVWTQDLASSPRRFRSELNFAIERAFREHGIEIPFPQRDLHIRSGTLKVDSAKKPD